MDAEGNVVSLSRSSALREFRKAVDHLPYRPKAIFPSEMFLFYLQSRDFDDGDLILESGIGYGGSTTYLVNLFPRTAIACVDSDSYWQFEKIKKELRNHRNALVHKADSTKLLPVLVERAQANRVAVLIDGPKKMVAVNLAARLLQNAKVKFVAVHDLPPQMSRMGDFHSWNAEWRKAYAFLDDKVTGEYRGYYPDGPGLTIFNAKRR